MKKMKKGFTIVELVIVIGVIAILSAVLIPTFVNLSTKAKKSVALQEGTDVYTAYVIDAGEAAKKQSEVVLGKGEYLFEYDFANGEWKEFSGETPTVILRTTDGDKTLGTNEAVVYQKA